MLGLRSTRAVRARGLVGAGITAGVLACAALTAPQAPACASERCGSDPREPPVLAQSQAYLAQRGDPVAAFRGRAGAIVSELALVAAQQHGKVIADRLPARVGPTDGPPMFVAGTPRGSSVFVTRSAVEGDRRAQVIYQLAHEAHHLACSPTPGAQPDVVLEMLATMFAVDVMERVDPAYADLAKKRLVAGSAQMTLDDLLADRRAVDHTELGVGYYGRAYVLGRALERRFGGDRVLALAGSSPAPRSGDTARLRRLVLLMRNGIA